MLNSWGSRYIRLPLSWLGADVYLDQQDGSLCYEADAERLVELGKDDFVYQCLKYRPRPVKEGV